MPTDASLTGVPVWAVWAGLGLVGYAMAAAAAYGVYQLVGAS